MWRNALMMDGLDSYQKYLLAQLYLSYTVGCPQRCTMSVLSKRFGVTTKVVCDGLEFFEERGFLTRSEDRSAKGRPATVFQLVGLPKTAALHAWRSPYANGVIQELLGDGARSKSERKLSLTVCNRMLLIILILHMDQCWTVKGLGHRRIANLVGVKKDTLKHRIKTLEQFGYIRDKVPGFTEGGFFGKAESVYFLNPCCRHWGKGYFAGGRLFYCSGLLPTELVGGYGEAWDEASQILGMASMIDRGYKKTVRGEHMHFLQDRLMRGRQIVYRSYVHTSSGLYKPVESGFFSCYRYFVGIANEVAFRNYLQYKLEDYAGLLLSEYWADVKAGDFAVDLQKTMIDHIKEDLKIDITKRILPEETEGFGQNSLQTDQELLADLIYQFSFGIARAFVLLLDSLEKVDCNFESMRYRLVPRVGQFDRWRFALELFPKGKLQSNPMFFKLYEKEDKGGVLFVAEQKESYKSLSSKELRACGLEKNPPEDVLQE